MSGRFKAAIASAGLRGAGAVLGADVGQHRVEHAPRRVVGEIKGWERLAVRRLERERESRRKVQPTVTMIETVRCP